MFNKIAASALLISTLCLGACGGSSSDSDSGQKVATKLCALTFDDGPDATKTAKVLDKLEKYGVTATFMWVGQNVNDTNKAVIDRIVSKGHEIGNHSWSYDDMAKMTAAEISDSVTKTSNAIKQYTGKEPKFFRAPNLSVSDTLYATVPYPFLSGGAIAKDWDTQWGGVPTAKERADNVINSMEDGTIILMHDVQPDPHPTPEALDIIIPDLLAKGYKFVTVSDLFKQKGITPKAGEKMQWTVVK